MNFENAVSSYVLDCVGERAWGRVHSVFATSLNVELDGFLLHVGDARNPLSCVGANVDAGELERLLARAQPGDQATYKQGVLTVYDVAATTAIDLRTLEVRSLSIASPIAAQRLATLEGALGALRIKEGIGLDWDARFDRVVRLLQQRDPSENDLREAIAFLLGRGLGLTPSGDDVLAGYGVALWLQGRVERFAETVLELLEGRTTDVSASYLRAMAAGYANQGYVELADAARAGEVERFPLIIEELRRVGHTSGDDGLFGFLVGLRSGNLSRVQV